MNLHETNGGFYKSVLKVHTLQIEGGVLCGSIDVVDNCSNVIADSGNNLEDGVWTNKKENFDWEE